jgi:hypothetical protein
VFPRTATDSTAPLIGEIVGGRFRVDELVAVGATGRVFRAEQLSLGRPVALKVLRAELAATPEAREQLRREALLAARLSHPNVATVIDCSRPDDDLAFVAWEYVRGDNLYKMLRREAQLEPGRAIDLMAQILGGLAEAHAAGVIHADVKSPNVVVAQQSSGMERAVLVDFGIALSTRAPELREGVVCGTPEYLAPEIIAGEPPSPAADIYGAGATLFELLAGKPPFCGDSARQTLVKQIEEPIPRFALSGSSELCDRLERIVRRALAKRPDARFRSAAEFRAALLGAKNLVAQNPAPPMTIRPRDRGRDTSAPPSTGGPETVDLHSPIAAIRAAIVRAIRDGDRERAGAAYLALASAHMNAGEPRQAIAELEEGLGLAARPANANGGDSLFWQLGLALSQAYELAGDDRSLAIALRSLAFAEHAGDVAGCVAAHRRLARIYASRSHDVAATRHRCAGERLECRQGAPRPRP